MTASEKARPALLLDEVVAGYDHGIVLEGVSASLVRGPVVALLGLAFIGVGVSHGSLAGLALGFTLKLDLLLGSVPFGIGLALTIGYLAERTRARFDAAVGVVFASSAERRPVRLLPRAA